MTQPLDCRDSGCTSPERSRTGQRTNRGCRCPKALVARAHERAAWILRESPSYREETTVISEEKLREGIVSALKLRNGMFSEAGLKPDDDTVCKFTADYIMGLLALGKARLLETDGDG